MDDVSLESDIQSDIMKALELQRGLRMFRNNTGAVRKRGRLIRWGLGVGSADLVGLLDGRFVALEVKKPGEKPSPEQVAWLADIRAHNGFTAVVTSVHEAMDAINRARSGACQ